MDLSEKEPLIWKDSIKKRFLRRRNKRQGASIDIKNIKSNLKIISYIDFIPDEILINILSLLDYQSVLKCRLVSVRWYRAVNDKYFWKLKSTFLGFPEIESLNWDSLKNITPASSWKINNKRKYNKISIPIINNVIAIGPRWRSYIGSPLIKIKELENPIYYEIIVNLLNKNSNTIGISFGVTTCIPESIYRCPFGYRREGFDRPEKQTSWSYLADGTSIYYSNGEAKLCIEDNRLLPEWKINDRIGLLINKQKKDILEIRFYHNGELVKKYTSKSVEGVYLVVSLFDGFGITSNNKRLINFLKIFNIC
jgi:hypothetical protein